MKRATLLLTAGLLLFLPSASWAQDVEVSLKKRTPVDDAGIGIQPLSKTPQEALKLPSVDTSAARFLSMHYNASGAGDETVSVMALPEAEGERLYVDRNNDEDLTNDGPPQLFPSQDDEFVFYIEGTSDPKQRTGQLLQRVPRLARQDPKAAKWFRESVVDEKGNLRPRFMRFAVHHGEEKGSGKKGTFYFDSMLRLSRGTVTLEGTEYMVGLLDYNGNGLFNDKRLENHSDLLLIDLNQDSSLTEKQETEAFKLYDVFAINGRRYKLTDLDPYGRRLRIAKTDEKATRHYLRAIEARRGSDERAKKGALDPSFWELELETVAGETIALSDLKGQHVLLNFWGEWCAPCLEELPALAAAREQMDPTELQMIGMLLTHDLQAAKGAMEKHEVTWPQVRLKDKLRERFRVTAYPTNILIIPDGETYVKRSGKVNEVFLEEHMRP